MFDLISTILMCGGGPSGGGAPAFTPAPIKQVKRSPASEIKRQQSTKRQTGPSPVVSSTLFAGLQGVGDDITPTGQTLLGG